MKVGVAAASAGRKKGLGLDQLYRTVSSSGNSTCGASPSTYSSAGGPVGLSCSLLATSSHQ